MPPTIHPTGAWHSAGNQPRQPAANNDTRQRDATTSSSAGVTPPARTSYDASSLRRVLNDQILATLGQEIDPSGRFDFSELDPQDFTPVAVAERILGFVENAITSAANTGDAALAKLEEARAGVERGFSQAKDILNSLGAFNGEVREDAEATYDLLHRGLEAMQRPLAAGGNVVGDFRPALRADEQSESQLISAQHASYSRSDRFSLRIKTQDGDTVTIQLQRQLATHSSTGYVRTDNGSAATTKESALASAGFRYTVDGNLDDGEREAIEQLLVDVKQLSDDFFTGDAAGAFEQALKLGYDTGEIAQFSLHMRQTETVKVAAAYREVASYQSEESDNGIEKLSNTLEPLRRFMNEMLENIERFEPRKFFDDTPSAIGRLFSDFSEQDQEKQAHIAKIEDLTGQPFANTMQQLIDAIRPA